MCRSSGNMSNDNPNMGRPSYCPFCGRPVDQNELSCKNCGKEIQKTYNYTCYPSMISACGEDKKKGFLLSCKNAWLTDTEFHYCNEKGQILNMVEAFVNAKGLLAIRFNNGKTEEFRLAPDDNAINSYNDVLKKETIGGAIRIGGVAGEIIGTIRVLNDNVKEKSVLWAAAINMLISKGNHEMINCYRCWTENKSTEPQCLHCGAIL